MTPNDETLAKYQAASRANFVCDRPYPGLRPFREDEHSIFFGRENQVGQLIQKLDTHCFVAVIGPSGCGKSSLIHGSTF